MAKQGVHRSPDQEEVGTGSAKEYKTSKFTTMAEFESGCRQNAQAGFSLDSWHPLLRAGAVEPQILAVFVKE